MDLIVVVADTAIGPVYRVELVVAGTEFVV
jgi:hypothetical protein